MFLPLVNRAGSRDSRVLVPVFDLCGDLSNSPSSRRVVSFSVITKLELSNTCWLLAFQLGDHAERDHSARGRRVGEVATEVEDRDEYS
jgi:hypothetical protein